MPPLRLLSAIGLLVAGFTVQFEAARAQQGATSTPEPQAKEEYTAIAANISNVGAAGLVPVNLHIDRWSSPAEQERLFAALREKGQDAFLKELTRSKPVGWIATPTSLRYEFFYAHQSATEKGRYIMLITDRPMAIAERMSAATSRDYPFTVVELRLNKEGRGTGTLAQLVQLRLLGDILGIENLATGPIQLNDVRKVK
jgi:hypothetical protein